MPIYEAVDLYNDEERFIGKRLETLLGKTYPITDVSKILDRVYIQFGPSQISCKVNDEVHVSDNESIGSPSAWQVRLPKTH
jgi:hypothetical protein